MAALNNSIPMLPKRFDLRDAVDHVDRMIEVTDQVVVQALGQVNGITVNPATGTVYGAGLVPRPSYITSGGGITAYEAALNATTTQDNLDAAGVSQLLATVEAKLAAIAKLT